jgi:hypothetical protein
MRPTNDGSVAHVPEVHPPEALVTERVYGRYRRTSSARYEHASESASPAKVAGPPSVTVGLLKNAARFAVYLVRGGAMGWDAAGEEMRR